MVELIKKKRNGEALNYLEYAEIVRGFVDGSIPDYQVSAFLMAAYFRGLNTQETADLTDLMMRSGDLIDLSAVKGTKVDKHSTGGVGDKTTLVLAPLVAAAGVPVAKMSGRGLGHTGGTLDKLEAIKGFSIEMSIEDFIKKVQKNGIALCGQTANLVPADKKLYALRDVTATVENMALIASSVMSKKLASGADAIVIDIKVGNGAFMKDLDHAIALGQIMIDIGAKMKRKVVAVLTGMEQPLGHAIGNSLEVIEAVETLKGNGPEDFVELCLELGSQMLILGGKAETEAEATAILKELIASGKALEKFKTFIGEQGGDTSFIDDYGQLPLAQYSLDIVAGQAGYISSLRAINIGLASMALGAGRETKESDIDYGAGIILKKKVGDSVEPGEALATLYTNDKSTFEHAQELMSSAYELSENPIIKQAIILQVLQ